MSSENAQVATDDKLLSIIIPSFNMEKYLKKCIESIVVADKELFRKLDILVVNDGSNDDTSAIAHSYGKKYQISPEYCHSHEYTCSNGTVAKVADYGIIQVIDKPNNHYGSCINATLVIAKGKYIRILDADDYFDTENFAKFLTKLANLPTSPDVVFSDYDTVDETGKVRTEFIFSNFYPQETIFDFSRIDNVLTPAKYHGAPCTTYRTQILKDMGYIQTEKILFTDTEWYILPFMVAKTMYYIKGSVLHYLIGRDGQSTGIKCMYNNFQKFENMMLHLLSVIEKMRAQEVRINQNFVDIRTFMIFVTMYNLVIFDFPKANLPDVDFRNTDREFQHLSPSHYEEFNNLKISRIKFHYIREWRKHYSRKTFKFLMFRIYTNVAKAFGSFLYKLRHS